MQKAMYPLKYMCITNRYDQNNHVGSCAIDDIGRDGIVDELYAPFDCVIKYTYGDANNIFIESKDAVLYADGTKKKMSMMFAHAENIQEFLDKKEFKQGELIYREGTFGGRGVGNLPLHVHLECGEGELTNRYWHSVSPVLSSIDNAKKPEECLWIDDSYVIINDGGFNWKNVKDDHQYDELIQQLQQRVNELKQLKKELEEELEESKKEYEALKEELANMPPLPEVPEEDKGKIKFRIFLTEDVPKEEDLS